MAEQKEQDLVAFEVLHPQCVEPAHGDGLLVVKKDGDVRLIQARLSPPIGFLAPMGTGGWDEELAFIRAPVRDWLKARPERNTGYHDVKDKLDSLGVYDKDDAEAVRPVGPATDEEIQRALEAAVDEPCWDEGGREIFREGWSKAESRILPEIERLQERCKNGTWLCARETIRANKAEAKLRTALEFKAAWERYCATVGEDSYESSTLSRIAQECGLGTEQGEGCEHAELLAQERRQAQEDGLRKALSKPDAFGFKHDRIHKEERTRVANTAKPPEPGVCPMCKGMISRVICQTCGGSGLPGEIHDPEPPEPEVEQNGCDRHAWNTVGDCTRPGCRATRSTQIAEVKLRAGLMVARHLQEAFNGWPNLTWEREQDWVHAMARLVAGLGSEERQRGVE